MDVAVHREVRVRFLAHLLLPLFAYLLIVLKRTLLVLRGIHQLLKCAMVLWCLRSLPLFEMTMIVSQLLEHRVVRLTRAKAV